MAKNKKWQNLLQKRCPVCGQGLEPCRDKTILYECLATGCEFIITRRKYADILMDKNHIMRRFLSGAEIKELDKVIQKVTS